MSDELPVPLDMQNIVASLRNEEHRLNGIRERLQASLKDNERDLARVQTALQSLGEKPAKKTRPSGKQPAPKSVVLEIARAILAENPVVTDEELRTQVLKRITNDGYAKSRFANRFQQVLKDIRATKPTPRNA